MTMETPIYKMNIPRFIFFTSTPATDPTGAPAVPPGERPRRSQVPDARGRRGPSWNGDSHGGGRKKKWGTLS